MTASCLAQAGPIHTTRRACSAAPQVDCQCGLWGVPRQEHLPKYGEFDGRRAVKHSEHLIVVGQVHLWGRVIEHEHGWRAQYAYPYELFVKPTLDDLFATADANEQARRVAAQLRATYLVDAVALPISS